MAAADLDADDLAALADEMFQTAKKKAAPAPPAKKAVKKPALEKQFEVYTTVDDAVSSSNGKRATSIDHLISGTVAGAADSDVIRMEIVALKPAGKLFLMRQLRAPSKPVLSLLKKLGHSELKINKEMKDSASFSVVRKRAPSSDSPKKKIVKKKKEAKTTPLEPAKPKAKEGDSKKRLVENMEKLKKKTSAAQGSVKMAVTASEVVASGSA